MNTSLTTPTRETEVKPQHFLILAFILSWMIWIPLVFSHFGIGQLYIPQGFSSLIGFLGVLMPAAVAIILTSRAGGKIGVRRLLRRLFIWRVSWKWWAAATLVYPGLLVISALSYNLYRGNQVVTFVRSESSAAVITHVIFLLIASLGEEIGWRGVALPGLQQKRSALASSIILGLCWGAWHLPFWLLQDSIDQFGAIYLVMNFLMLPSLFLGIQHCAVPLLFDLPFFTWRLLMYIPFAFQVGVVLHWRPRLLPYLVVIHVVMDLSFAAMLFSAAY